MTQRNKLQSKGHDIIKNFHSRIKFFQTSDSQINGFRSTKKIKLKNEILIVSKD